MSNALYALCKIFLAPGIQTLTNESAQFKHLIVGVALSASDESTILSENTRYRMSIQVESIIKIKKNASTFHSLEENLVFGSSYVQDGKSCYSPKTYYTGYIVHLILFPSRIMNTCSYLFFRGTLIRLDTGEWYISIIATKIMHASLLS